MTGNLICPVMYLRHILDSISAFEFDVWVYVLKCNGNSDFPVIGFHQTTTVGDRNIVWGILVAYMTGEIKCPVVCLQFEF